MCVCVCVCVPCVKYVKIGYLLVKLNFKEKQNSKCKNVEIILQIMV